MEDNESPYIYRIYAEQEGTIVSALHGLFYRRFTRKYQLIEENQ
jgi:hypothetical protein